MGSHFSAMERAELIGMNLGGNVQSVNRLLASAIKDASTTLAQMPPRQLGVLVDRMAPANREIE